MRPGRWDEPFQPDMSARDVDKILSLEPFASMDAEAFPPNLPLRDVLRNDVALRLYKHGEIVVRQGDYGSSAFFIVSGQLRVVVKPPLAPEVLGHSQHRRRGLFRALSQWWGNHRYPEVREQPSARFPAGVDQVPSRQGRSSVVLQDVPVVIKEHATATLGPGQFFGEISALGRVPRTATIFANGPARLLEMRWQGLRDLKRHDPSLDRHLQRIYRERSLESQLMETDLLNGVPAADVERVVAQTQFETHGDFEWHGSYKELRDRTAKDLLKMEPVIIEEGHYPNGLILVGSGFVRVSEGTGAEHRTVGYLSRGDHFGLDELAHNWRRPEQRVPFQRSLRAVGHAHVLLIPTSLVEELILPRIPKGRLPAFVRPKSERDRVRDRSDSRSHAQSEALDYLVNTRFVNGTAAMVVDLDRCTSCDDCVRACASTHDGNPRFVRRGPQLGSHMVANACMHCEDPVCMIGCPTGAIHRAARSGEVVVNPVTCIGCAICANSCPYDNIRMVAIRRPDGEPWEDPATHEPFVKATKCDLCVDQLGGPACQRACPHDALVRVDLSSADTALARWKP